jgi:hypothetical protein
MPHLTQATVVSPSRKDLCSKAIDPSQNTTSVGSIADAIQDFYLDTCLGEISGSRDLWYQVVGNGAGILASLCNPETDFDSQLSIYSSIDADESSSTLECLVTMMKLVVVLQAKCCGSRNKVECTSFECTGLEAASAPLR